MKTSRMPLLAVDAVIFLGKGIVLIKRKNPPFKGCYALPGGFVEVGETTEEAACRESMEETGLKIKILDLIGVYSDPARDPRGHIVSVSYLAKGYGNPNCGSDAQSIRVFAPDELPQLAFDHKTIIRDALMMKPRYDEDHIGIRIGHRTDAI